MNFTDYCAEIPREKCQCGYEGLTYMFVSVNGQRKCVRCAGCKEAVDDRACAKREAARRGAEKSNRSRYV